jgi:hypothetical protein
MSFWKEDAPLRVNHPPKGRIAKKTELKKGESSFSMLNEQRVNGKMVNE